MLLSLLSALAVILASVAAVLTVAVPLVLGLFGRRGPH